MTGNLWGVVVRALPYLISHITRSIVIAILHMKSREIKGLGCSGTRGHAHSTALEASGRTGFEPQGVLVSRVCGGPAEVGPLSGTA